MSEGRASNRYPDTYGADYLREELSHDVGFMLSRAAAIRIEKIVAFALRMDSVDISIALAEQYLKKYEITEEDEDE